MSSTREPRPGELTARGEDGTGDTGASRHVPRRGGSTAGRGSHTEGLTHVVSSRLPFSAPQKPTSSCNKQSWSGQPVGEGLSGGDGRREVLAVACPWTQPTLHPSPEAHRETRGTRGPQGEISLLAGTLVPRTSAHWLRWSVTLWSTTRPGPPSALPGGTGNWQRPRPRPCRPRLWEPARFSE